MSIWLLLGIELLAVAITFGLSFLCRRKDDQITFVSGTVMALYMVCTWLFATTFCLMFLIYAGPIAAWILRWFGIHQ